jgi:hypothetical protein
MPANREEGGTRLGLAIARDIARSHGGDITPGESPMGGLRATARVPVQACHHKPAISVSDEADLRSFLRISANDPKRAIQSDAIASATMPLGKVEGCGQNDQCVHFSASLDWLWRA